MKKINSADLKDKNVILRTDFNVPIDSRGHIIDDMRIKATLPTIKYILNSNAEKLYIISHLGEPIVRPRTDIKSIISGNKNLVLEPVAKSLAKWLKMKAGNIKSSDIKNSPLPGYILSDKITLLENVRFLYGEKKNDEDVAKKLALLGEVYVDDAFGTLHRKHASVCAITKFLPSYYGLLIEKELKILDKLLKNPTHPFVMILGGAKIKDKMQIIKKMLKKVDYFLLGGVMANTFLATRNIDVKNSVVEKECLDLAQELMGRAAKKIILPTDLVWDKGRIVDIKQGTTQQYKRYINKAKLIFLNGTMGLTSQNKYCKGTKEILKMIAENSLVHSIISGGDTIAEVKKNNLSGKFSFISTGGGATLNYLAGEKLPGLETLDHSEND